MADLRVTRACDQKVLWVPMPAVADALRGHGELIVQAFRDAQKADEQDIALVAERMLAHAVLDDCGWAGVVEEHPTTGAWVCPRCKATNHGH